MTRSGGLLARNHPLVAGLGAVVQRQALDRRLAEGAERRTLRMARNAVAREPGSVLAVQAPVLEEGEALSELAERLEAPGPMQPMGGPLARLLVTDLASPLRVGSAPGTLYVDSFERT